MKKDDHCLNDVQQREVDKSADLLLKKADAYGRFPTPIPDLILAADLELSRENALDTVFLGDLYRNLPNSIKLMPDRLKRALEKVLGVLDRPARTIYLDPTVHKNKRPFLSLHEVAHDFLSWQKRTFDLLEDSESELDEDIRDEFERQANCFASDVLFQRDAFRLQAADSEFAIKVPIDLSKHFGSSIYAAIRRYVTTNALACAALVFERPEPEQRVTRLVVRRGVGSVPFENQFGRNWMKSEYGPGEFFIEHLPYKKFSKATHLRLRDQTGNSHDCVVEAFNSTKQVFFLIRSLRIVARAVITV